jgi:hypothetical protein
MKRYFPSTSQSAFVYAAATVLVAVLVGVLFLNPVWSRFAIPGMFPKNLLPPVTAPVDGLYYIRNAEIGFQWTTQDPLSLWFHPLLSWILMLFPRWLPLNYWFWMLGLLFALASLPLIYRLTALLSDKKHIPAWLLPLCLLAPGGLGMATGNAEFPTLFFVLGLTLSVLAWDNWCLTIAFAALAMLAKPNALYMVPILLVYIVTGLHRKDRRLWKHALIGTVALLGTWFLWTSFVDWKAGNTGVYWKMRLLSKYYLGEGGATTIFDQLALAFFEHDVRNMIRYSTALLIPLVSLLVIGYIPLADQIHRYAMAAGNLTMLAITLFLVNPNKIIVYTSTLPGHFPAHILLCAVVVGILGKVRRTQRIVIGVLYALYCIGILGVFVYGTPMRWYH